MSVIQAFDSYHFNKLDLNDPAIVLVEEFNVFNGGCRQYGAYVNKEYTECEEKTSMTCDKLHTITATIEDSSDGSTEKIGDLLDVTGLDSTNKPLPCDVVAKGFGLSCTAGGAEANTCIDAPPKDEDHDKCSSLQGTEDDALTKFEGGWRCKWIEDCEQDLSATGAEKGTCKIKPESALTAIAASVVGLIAMASF